MRNISKVAVGLGIALIIVTGLIHIIDAPDAFEEITYKGVLFVANGGGALLAAYGIARGARWGWWLALLVAGGAFIGYVASRTVGLPGLEAEPDEWLEPLGVLSLIVEGTLVGLTVWAMRASEPEPQPSAAPMMS